MNKTWIRRDRDTGKISEVDELYVKNLFHKQGYYKNLSLAMKHDKEDMPISTGFADYYPKEA